MYWDIHVEFRRPPEWFTRTRVVSRKGNWISGIKFIDEMRLGPQDNLPESMTNNKARNMMFFLPFILGIIGMVYHYSRDNKDAWVVMLLFFLVRCYRYLSQRYPTQPRERDYAHAGSYYAFAIWIGLGVLSFVWIPEKEFRQQLPLFNDSLCALLLYQALWQKLNGNDHDRSDRYTSRDFATDYLQFLWTQCDPVYEWRQWYIPSVVCAGSWRVRTDVRVVNLSLLNTDWYVDQLKRKYYDSDPIISWAQDKYMLGRRGLYSVLWSRTEKKQSLKKWWISW